MLKSKLHFMIHCAIFKIRDCLKPRRRILDSIKIERGFSVLDYGCGSGSYIIPLVEIVGNNGRVYACDVNPFAIQKIKSIILKKHITNVEIIHSACETGLLAESINVILLYDVFHCLDNSNKILQELYRVLKRDGILSFRDHRMKRAEIISNITNGKLFQLSDENSGTFNFAKVT